VSEQARAEAAGSEVPDGEASGGADDAGAGVRRFLAPRSDRLDRLVATEVPELSRAQARRLVEEGAVTVAGEPERRPSHAVQPDAPIEVALPVLHDPLSREADRLAAEVPLPLLYEDEETLVIDKPAGLVVHPRDGVMGVTLVNVVRARYPEVRQIGDGNRPGVVHRLDRDTSGAMAYAKSLAAQEALKAQWKARETLKLYLALVEGELDPRAGIIDAPLGPDPTNPSRQAVVERGSSALSEYRVLEQYGTEAALLSVRIQTGRTHQIRVHLAAVGHPVVGDWLYGDHSELIDRQALHAARLGFVLPSTGEWREFEAPLPEDMERALAELRLRHGVAAAAVPTR
jgi:23S rRNA pseudouridine1911/1915/1917 synthase